MADRYFKKDKNVYSVGNTDKIIKYDRQNHDLDSFKARFIECDANGKEIKKATKKAKKGDK